MAPTFWVESIPRGTESDSVGALCVVPRNRNDEAAKAEGGSHTGCESRFRYSPSCHLVDVRLAQIHFTWTAKRQELAWVKDVNRSGTLRTFFPIAHVSVSIIRVSLFYLF